MAPRKTERLVNLTICLLTTRRFLPREEIRQAVLDYRELTDEAFERAFERDKDELRALGVPIEMGNHEAYFDDEVGYRISRQDFELPPIELTAEEAAAVLVASRSWQQARHAESSMAAISKLRAAGVSADTARLDALMPTVNATEPAFEAIWDAVLTGTPLRFGYRGDSAERHLEPWKIVSHRGKWYVIGFDTDRQDRRMFKLSRITAGPEPDGEPGTVVVPPEVDLSELGTGLDPARPDRTATLAIRTGTLALLRRSAEPADWSRPLPTGYAAHRVEYASTTDFAAEVVAGGPDVLVLDPPELRERVLGLLHAVADQEGQR